MDMRDFETRFLTLEGLKRFGHDNQFISDLIVEQAYSMKSGNTIHNVGWYIAPLINGVIRSGAMEDKLNMFKALAEFDETIVHTPKRATKSNPDKTPVELTLQKYMSQMCVTIKRKQDNEIKKSVQAVNERIVELGLDNNKIIVLDVTDMLNQTFTGLVANKLATQYKRPCILLREKKKNQGVYGGSGRNYSRFGLDNLREFLVNSELFESAEGHSEAFGVTINGKNIKAFSNYANEQLKDVSTEEHYFVDYAIPVGRLKEKHVMQVGQWSDLWGNKLDCPTFAITNITIDSESVKLLGEKKNFIKFDVVRGDNKITFVKKYANEELYNQIIHKTSRGLSNGGSKKLELTVIGKFTINEWESNDKVFKTPQIEIVAIDSKVVSKKVMF